VYFGEKLVARKGYDLLHPTYYQPYFLSELKGKPYIITVYDMIHELYVKDYKELNNNTVEYKKETICKANQIIAISESTKNDLLQIYGIPENKIEVIYLGNPLEGVRSSKVEGLPQKYILFVGSRLGYKNFIFFVSSIERLLRENTKLFLICAGGPDFSTKERMLLSKLKIGGQVKRIKFKNDNELGYIYKNALAYVLPSLYEGFGMQALEAMSMGCPVVASKTSSIPEVCGNAAVYIDPEDARSISSGVRKVLNNQELRNDLIKLGFKQVKKFSWKKMVQETLRVYEKVLIKWKNGKMPSVS
jgi:glycosyltransferase involved in cell wall biosynthesis